MNIKKKFLLLLICFSFIEGVSTLILFFIAMPLKYIWEMPMAVTISGNIHGYLFIGLVMLFFIGKIIVPLTFKIVSLGVLAAIIPFGPLLVHKHLFRLLKETP